MIIRFLLALLFVFTVLSAPVSASCAIDSAEAQMGCCCCCCEIADDGCSIGEDCCDSQSPESVATIRTHLTAEAPSFNAPKVEQAFCTTQLERGPPVTRESFYLADNKLYLKKRSLLI
jgi:hypothetical protein